MKNKGVIIQIKYLKRDMEITVKCASCISCLQPFAYKKIIRNSNHEPEFEPKRYVQQLEHKI